MVITDEYVNELFEGTNFGKPINESVDKKREQLAKTLRDQVAGYWSGHTAYNIAVHGGLLIDAKTTEQKRLTKLGHDFMAEFSA